jgi:hypothetical protein
VLAARWPSDQRTRRHGRVEGLGLRRHVRNHNQTPIAELGSAQTPGVSSTGADGMLGRHEVRRLRVGRSRHLADICRCAEHRMPQLAEESARRARRSPVTVEPCARREWVNGAESGEGREATFPLV